MCINCMALSAEIMELRMYIAYLELQNANLKRRIETAKSIARDAHRYTRQTRRDDWQVLRQDSGVERGKWSYHKGSFERLEPCQKSFEQILRT